MWWPAPKQPADRPMARFAGGLVAAVLGLAAWIFSLGLYLGQAASWAGAIAVVALVVLLGDHRGPGLRHWRIGLMIAGILWLVLPWLGLWLLPQSDEGRILSARAIQEGVARFGSILGPILMLAAWLLGHLPKRDLA